MLDHCEKVFLVDSETMKARAEVMMEQKNSADRGFWLCGPKGFSSSFANFSGEVEEERKLHKHSEQLQSATEITRILSEGMQGNITLAAADLIQSGVVDRFIGLIRDEEFPRLQYEAARGLTVIAAFKPDLLVYCNAGPFLVKLLASSRYYVREQAMWALGNLAGHSIHRDYVLKSGALRPLLSQLYEDTNLSVLRIATRTLSNLCYGMLLAYLNEVKPALELHLNSRDEEVLRCVCLAISYLCDGSIDGIQSVIEAGFVPKLVEVLRHPSPVVLSPVLRTIGIIVTVNNHQSQVVIDCGALHILGDLLTRAYERYIKADTFLTISRITTGFTEQLQAVIDANLIPRFVYLAQNNELDLKKEGVWAISNVTAGGSHDQIIYLVQQGCIKPLCDLLVCPDVRIILVCLDGLENILNVGEANIGEVNDYCQLVEDAQGLEKIQNLRQHGSYEIYAKALKILETFWHDE
ncbi:Armadillo [Arabidopsis suecica]|uniref:Importin subunit alpha n=1 Tax=Arabidopsis suecica TaxID=45249 RepID=A0A8T2DLQ9_ARASU|nr:Armadillo [Arabidopsis suecica]